MAILGIGYEERSEKQKNRRDREGNNLLISILNEFGRRTFSQQDIIESIGCLTTSPSSEERNKGINIAFQNLVRRQLIVAAYTQQFEISEAGHELTERLEISPED